MKAYSLLYEAGTLGEFLVFTLATDERDARVACQEHAAKYGRGNVTRVAILNEAPATRGSPRPAWWP